MQIARPDRTATYWAMRVPPSTMKKRGQNGTRVAVVGRNVSDSVVVLTIVLSDAIVLILWQWREARSEVGPFTASRVYRTNIKHT